MEKSESRAIYTPKGEVKVEEGQLAIDGSLEATTVSVDKALRIAGTPGLTILM